MSSNVAVIGAGVSGLTCGVLLAEAGRRTTILARELGAETTSGAAAAIWYPYDAEPARLVSAWSLQSFDVLRELARDPITGVSMIELRVFARAGEIAIPDWAIRLGAARLAAVPAVFSSGFAITVPLVDTTIFLPYLQERFERAAGEIRTGVSYAALADIELRYGTIINCTGIGAKELAGDADVEPHRGQVELVAKLDLPFAVVCDDPPLMYAIPRANDCVLGGTNDVSDDCAPDPRHAAQIVAECARVLGVELPRVVRTRVGLRPYRRSGIRLESELLADGRHVIHNYGHGGSGFTLAWGCARAAVALLEQAPPIPKAVG